MGKGGRRRCRDHSALLELGYRPLQVSEHALLEGGWWVVLASLNQFMCTRCS